jgi:hypothetical protein
MSTQLNNSDFILYVYFIKNPDLILCQGCCNIPELNKMYRINNTKLSYCENCINKWIISKYINPVTGHKLEKNDTELNYEINKLIKIYNKYKKLDIKNISINISIDKNDNLLAH